MAKRLCGLVKVATETSFGGFNRLIQTANDLVAQRCKDVGAYGESPIETLLIQAIDLRFLLAAPEFDELDIVDSDDEKWNLNKLSGGPCIICRPQADIVAGPRGEEVKWRCDFLFHSRGLLYRGGGAPVVWRRLIVECDGHEFHERTKEQAARDRSRDRAATLSNYDILRFTGSQIWNDPWGCAGEVAAWAYKGMA